MLLNNHPSHRANQIVQAIAHDRASHLSSSPPLFDFAFCVYLRLPPVWTSLNPLLLPPPNLWSSPTPRVKVILVYMIKCPPRSNIMRRKCRREAEDSMYVCDILLAIAAGREEFIPWFRLVRLTGRTGTDSVRTRLNAWPINSRF